MVDFRLRVTFTEDLRWLQEKRVARMDVTSRRDLRLRLGAWYARVEDDDRVALAAVGEPSGFTVQGQSAEV
jgi:hypothetical protein